MRDDARTLRTLDLFTRWQRMAAPEPETHLWLRRRLVLAPAKRRLNAREREMIDVVWAAALAYGNGGS